MPGIISDPSDPSHRDSRKDHYLRYQPFIIVEAQLGNLRLMSFFIDGAWHSLQSILALPDE